MMACMIARMWRLSFAVVCDGRERVLGRPATAPRMYVTEPPMGVEEGLRGVVETPGQLHVEASAATIPSIPEGSGDVRESGQESGEAPR